MALDILAAQRLYGAATSGPLASGGRVFGFNANIEGYIGRFYDFSINQHPVVTLWSGGTGNALNLSGFSSDSTINLSPGTFSSAAGLINNIGIAFGTVIETAIGGGGNDTLLGNDLHNFLRGGAGNDLVRGGVGNDSLWGDSGNDTLSGGIGADVIDPGTGIDIVRDRLVDLNSDMIFGFGRATTVDITGSLIGRDALTVTQFGSTTAIGAGWPVLRSERPLLGRRFHVRGARQRRQCAHHGDVRELPAQPGRGAARQSDGDQRHRQRALPEQRRLDRLHGRA